MSRSIIVSTTSIEVPAEKDLNTSFTVTIDGSNANGSFTVHPVEEDWIDVIRDGNTIYLSLKRNLSLYERVCVITVEHNVIRGEEGIKQVNVVQKPMVCTLDKTDETHTFALFPKMYKLKSGKTSEYGSPITEEVYNTLSSEEKEKYVECYEEEKAYDVIVKGGSKNIRLLSIKKYYVKKINFEEITGYKKGGQTITVDAYNELSDLDKLGYEPFIEKKTGTKKIYVPNDGCIGVKYEYIERGVESGDEFKKYKITLTSLGKTYFDVEEEGTTTTYQCNYEITFAHCDDLAKKEEGVSNNLFVITAIYEIYNPKTNLTPTQPNPSVQTRTVKKKPSKPIKKNETVEEIVIEPMFELDIDSDTIEFEHGVKESATIGYKALPEGSVLHIRTTSSLITGNYDDKYVYLNVSPKAWGLEKKIGITIENINCYSDTYNLTGIIKPL